MSLQNAIQKFKCIQKKKKENEYYVCWLKGNVSQGVE